MLLPYMHSSLVILHHLILFLLLKFRLQGKILQLNLLFASFVHFIFSPFKGLEKNPLYEVKQFRPPSDIENNKMAANAENLLETVMHRLADRVRIRRIQVLLSASTFFFQHETLYH